MQITQIRLQNFRNYQTIQLPLTPGTTILTGNNGQGKTNLLESVYLCCTGRSHRTSKDKEMINFQTETAFISITLTRAEGQKEIQISFSKKDKRKRVRINGTQATKIGDLMGHLSGVLFSPEDLKIIKEGPTERRRFTDIMLSQARPAYFFALQSYYRALAQRNYLLKQQSKRALPEFTEQLATQGITILKYRYDFLEKLREIAEENHNYLSGAKETLTLRYSSQISPNDLSTPEKLYNLLESRQEDDLRHGTTSAGPHRDDLILTINGKDLRSYGSQGQQRTAALSLKLSELDLMTRETGETPVLMLDDVMSELDPSRKSLLLDRLTGVQTIITCTDKNETKGAKEAAYYQVSNGVISPM